MRITLLSLAAILITACGNVVVSDQPMLAENEPGRPIMRPGLWIEVRADCGGDPPQDWTTCADTVLIGADGRLMSGETVHEAILTGSDPVIIQVSMFGDRLTGRSLDDQAASRRSDPPRPSHDARYYVYLVGRPTALGASGEINALSVAFLMCDPRESDPHPVRPMTGLVMDEEGGNCLPKDRTALVEAAKASAKAPQTFSSYRWLRPLTPSEAGILNEAQSTIAE